jgi:hypothetical protein
VSDSLGRLILRAQGRLPTVEPLLPSRYADAQAPAVDWLEQTVDVDASAPVQPDVAGRRAPPELARSFASRPSPQPRRLPAAPSTGGRIEEQMASARAATGTSEPRVQARLSGRPSIPGEPGSPLLDPAPGGLPDDPSFSPAVFVAAEVHPAAADRPGMSEPEPELLAPAVIVSEPPARQPAAPLTPELIPQRAFAASAAERLEPPGARGLPSRPARPIRPAADTTQGSALPEVRISIGRVEVHAAAPRPLPARQSAVHRPTVSLADYLAKRGGKAP